MTDGFRTSLDGLQSSHSRVYRALAEGEESRQHLLNRYSSGVRLTGAEALLRHLDEAGGFFAENEQLARLQFLITRSIVSFEVCLEAGLSGLFAVAADSMRAVMEIEFLLWEFTANQAAVDDWLTRSDAERQQRYSPNRLRQLRANRLGVAVTDLRDHYDYKGHSLVVHVVPRTAHLATRIKAGERNPYEDAFFWEFFEHGRRLIEACDAFVPTRVPTWTLSATQDELAPFRKGWERTTEWQTLLRAMSEAASRVSAENSTTGA